MHFGHHICATFVQNIVSSKNFLKSQVIKQGSYFSYREPGINRRIMLNAIPKGRAVELLIAHATEIFGPQPKIEQKIETVETQ